MIEQSKKVGPWRDAVRSDTAAAVAGQGVAMAAGRAVHVDLTFYLARPASAPRRVLLPAKRPDLDKLIRSTLDGLKDGGALADDGQVTALAARKAFAAEHDPPGCLAWVQPDPRELGS